MTLSPVDIGLLLLFLTLAILAIATIILILNVNKIIIHLQKILRENEHNINESLDIIPKLLKEYYDIGYLARKNIDELDKGITNYRKSILGAVAKVSKTAGVFGASFGIASKGVTSLFKLFKKK